MAPNKSSAPRLLPSNSNKLIQALMHALLEWILIILLLLDSLFFYLIARFANMFALQPPCRWCSRLDHHTLSIQGRSMISSGSYKDVCEIHATEISKLGYCSDHRNLAESQNMCAGCLSSSHQINYGRAKSSHRRSMSEIADARSRTRSCSCCGATSVISDVVRPGLLPRLLKSVPDVFTEEGSVTISGCCLGSASGSGPCGVNRESDVTSREQKKGDCCGDIDYEGAESEEHGNELFLSDVSSFLHHRSEGSDEEEEQDGSGAATAALQTNGGHPGENETRKISMQDEAIMSCTTVDHPTRSGTENRTKEVIEATKPHPDKTPWRRGGLENYAMETKTMDYTRTLPTEIEFEADNSLTTEQLRSALQAERKARAELCAELEAERNASAIAANQTIAMITRLQEEKAAIQLEASQYQRMMEEQSEYDQEALRLLSELVSKRDKEKQELEKELGVFHGRALRYEDKGKAVLIEEIAEDLSGSKDNDSGNEDDHDTVLSIDLNNRQIEKMNNDDDSDLVGIMSGGNQDSSSQDITTSTGMVLKSVNMVLEHVKQWRSLDDSLTEFEQERLSIIHQLKELEDKLYVLDDEENREESDGEEQIFKDVKPLEDCFEDEGRQFDHEVLVDTHLCNAEVNLAAAATAFSTHKMITENQSKTLASAAHGLLHLLGPEDDDGDDNDVGIEQEMSSDCSLMEEGNSVTLIDAGKKKRLAIEKEVDHVYGRLHALEADREFLRHCVTSLSKGNEGIVLLQEVLQHLRELKTVKICV